MAAKCGSALLAHAGASGISSKVALCRGRNSLVHCTRGPAPFRSLVGFSVPPSILVRSAFRAASNHTLRKQEQSKEEVRFSRRTCITGGASFTALAGPLIRSYKMVASAAESGEGKDWAHSIQFPIVYCATYFSWHCG